MLNKFSIAIACALFAVVPVYAAELVNINTADLTALQTLNGIGPSKAQAIIDYRTKSGPFATIEDIMNVSGIGTATFNGIKDFITVGNSSPTAEQNTQTQNQTQTQTAATTAAVSGGALPPVVSASITGSMHSLVGAGSFFDGAAYNAQGEPLLSGVRYMWNFGDGAVAEGKRVFHAYAYPGRYSVQLTIGYNYSSSGARMQVEVEPGAVALTAENDGSLVLWNNTAQNVDVGWWLLIKGDSRFVIPDGTMVFAREGLRFAPAVTNIVGTVATTQLWYPNNVLALAAAPAENSPLRGERITSAQKNAVKAATVPTVEKMLPAIEKSTLAAAAAASGTTVPWWTYGALALVVGLGVAGVYAAQRPISETVPTAEEFDIE